MSPVSTTGSYPIWSQLSHVSSASWRRRTRALSCCAPSLLSAGRATLAEESLDLRPEKRLLYHGTQSTSADTSNHVSNEWVRYWQMSSQREPRVLNDMGCYQVLVGRLAGLWVLLLRAYNSTCSSLTGQSSHLHCTQGIVLLFFFWIFVRTCPTIPTVETSCPQSCKK